VSRRGREFEASAFVAAAIAILPVTRPQVRRRLGPTPDLRCVAVSPQAKTMLSASGPVKPTSVTEPCEEAALSREIVLWWTL
jgi:hypothetical protein